MLCSLSVRADQFDITMFYSTYIFLGHTSIFNNNVNDYFYVISKKKKKHV
jgi:hypothetical protein